MVMERSARFNTINRISALPTPPRTPTRRPSGASASRTTSTGSAYGSSAAAARPTYTPWTGGGNDAWMGSPGDQGIIEYGVNRTRPTPAPPPGPTPAPPPAPRTPQLSDYSRDFRDPEYNAQIASLQRALADFETGAQQRAERYGIDYLQGVRNIGYRPAPGFVAMPNILEAGQGDAAPMARSARAITGADEPDATEGMQGQWDIEGQFDPYSAAARGTRGLRDEFAARGTLRSSDFGQTFGEFQNRLNEQLEAMETGRTRFAEDLSSELAQQRTSTEERRQATERAAQQRAATAQMNAFMQALAGG